MKENRPQRMRVAKVPILTSVLALSAEPFYHGNMNKGRDEMFAVLCSSF